jgi:MFS family permease
VRGAVTDGRLETLGGELFASTMAWGGFLFAFTLYLQAGLDYSALQSGLIFLPYGAGFAVASLAYTRLPARLRPRLPAVGLLIMGVGYVALGLVDHSGWHPVSSAALLALAGAGYGVGFSPVMATAVASVPARRARDASGILTTAVQMSYAVGLTVLGSYFLGHAAPGDADRGGHAFTSVTYILAGLSVVAASLAGARAWSAVAGWRRSRLEARPLSEGAGR